VFNVCCPCATTSCATTFSNPDNLLICDWVVSSFFLTANKSLSLSLSGVTVTVILPNFYAASQPHPPAREKRPNLSLAVSGSGAIGNVYFCAA